MEMEATVEESASGWTFRERGKWEAFGGQRKDLFKQTTFTTHKIITAEPSGRPRAQGRGAEMCKLDASKERFTVIKNPAYGRH